MKAILLLPQPVQPEHFGDAAKDWPAYKPDPRFVMAPKDTEIEHPEAFWLVRFGSARPGDEECRQAAGMTDAQVVRQHGIYKAVEAGKLVYDAEVES